MTAALDQNLRIAPIAGIPFRETIDAGIRIRSVDGEAWTGSAETEAAVVVHHCLGSARPSSSTPAMDMRPWSSFHTSMEGFTEVLFRPMLDGVPTRLLTTVRPGLEYEVRYEALPAVEVEQRDKELALFPLVLAVRQRGMLVHACGFQLSGGPVVLAPGVSGTGKSTLARLVGAEPGVRVLNDDRIAVTVGSAELHAWSTPWPGREGIARAGDGPLSLIAFLRHADRMQARDVRPRDGAQRLLQMVALPLWDRHHLAEALDVVDRMVTNYPLIELAYPETPQAGAWIVETCRRIAK